MTDDQATGSCVTCHRRDPREGWVCGPCRSRMRSWLYEIPDLYTQLLDEPLAPSGSPGKGGPVSGSRERPIPIRVDLFDLTHPGAGEALYGADQVGHVPVWMTLQTWAADWMQVLDRGETGPEWWVGGFCSWMRVRVDDVCDIHPAVDEAWREIRALHGAMSAQLGLFEKPDYRYGVPCRQCNALALVRHDGSDFIECGDCPAVLTPEEYDRWVQAVAAAVKKMEKAA